MRQLTEKESDELAELKASLAWQQEEMRSFKSDGTNDNQYYVMEAKAQNLASEINLLITGIPEDDDIITVDDMDDIAWGQTEDFNK